MDIELVQALKEIADVKELIRKMLYEYQRLCLIKKETIAEAENFLIEPNSRKHNFIRILSRIAVTF